MMMFMFGKCKDHLHGVRESYFQHMGFAFSFGGQLIAAGLAAIIHALIPALFQTTASTILFSLNDRLRARMSSQKHLHDA